MATSLFRKQGEQLTKVTTTNGITTVVPNAGGFLHYYQSSTTTNQTTFANAAGTIPNSNPLELDSDGRLQTPVYLGDSDTYSAYTEDHKDSDGASVSTLWPVNDIPAAVPASAAASTFAYPDVPWEVVTSASSPVTILTADAGNAYETDTTGGSVTLNLPSAISVGVGKCLWFKKTSASNSMILHPYGTQEIDGVNADYTVTRGQSTFMITSNGANWKITTSSYRMPPVSLGGFKRLVVTNNSSAPMTKVDIDADNAILVGSDLEYIVTGTVDITIDSGASGINGLDTGTLSVSTWYYNWVISNGVDTRGIMSLSSSSPLMPTGYTYKEYAGAIYNTASLGFIRITQNGNRTSYKVVSGSSTPNMPIIATGVSGNSTTPTWVSYSISSIVPPTSTSIIVVLGNPTAANASSIFSTNNNYGGITTATNQPMLGVDYQHTISTGTFILESTNVYYAGNGVLSCCGWIDSIV